MTMAKKTKHLGEGAMAALTAADAVGVASGSRRQPVQLVRKREAEEEDEAPEGWMVTTVQLRKDQCWALQEESLRRARRRGKGRAANSSILREAFDLWLRLPEEERKRILGG